MLETMGEVKLTTIESLVVSTEIGGAERVTIGAVGPERGIVSRSLMIGSLTLRMAAVSVVGVAGSVFRTDAEAFVIGAGNQGFSVGRWRRSHGIVRMRSTASDKKDGCGKKRQFNTREIHGVLTIRFACG
jgi:hypothetical protein